MQESTSKRKSIEKSISVLRQSFESKSDDIIKKLEQMNFPQSTIEEKKYEEQIEYLQSIIFEQECKILEMNNKVKQLEDFIATFYPF